MLSREDKLTLAIVRTAGYMRGIGGGPVSDDDAAVVLRRIQKGLLREAEALDKAILKERGDGEN